jgi:hypothetical protein
LGSVALGLGLPALYNGRVAVKTASGRQCGRNSTWNAYKVAGYKKSSAKANATRLMENDGIAARIAELRHSKAQNPSFLATNSASSLST